MHPDWQRQQWEQMQHLIKLQEQQIAQQRKNSARTTNALLWIFVYAPLFLILGSAVVVTILWLIANIFA
jgi:hypothetical protein